MVGRAEAALAERLAEAVADADFLDGFFIVRSWRVQEGAFMRPGSLIWGDEGIEKICVGLNAEYSGGSHTLRRLRLKAPYSLH